MKPFLSRNSVRQQLLHGVYEQNLTIVGIKVAFRRRRRFPLRPGVLSIVLLGTILLGQPVPLSSFLWGSAPPLPESGAQQSREWRGGDAPVAAPSDTNVSTRGLAVALRDAAVEESNAAEYRALAHSGGLKIRKVFGLGVKTIMIDPGHGGPSAVGAIGKGGTAEKVITLDIAKKLRAALQKHTDYRILMTREEDVELALKRRVEMANDAKADLFISIHVNSLPTRPIDIVETYYFGPTQDKKTLELATEVNDGSDYSFSEYNEVIKEISNQLKYQESRRLARFIQDTLYQSLKQRKPDVLDFGVKRAPFVVLLGVAMPAVLVEVACLSNAEEEERLRSATYRETIAASIQAGIVRYLGDGKKRSGSS
jgi:N-acetylmuramoyl-L-alanine amidase